MNTLLSTTDEADIALPNHILAFEMRDDSMHPRISLGEYALLAECADVEDEVGEEVLVQLDDGQWHLRTVAQCSDTAITLSTYNPPSEAAVDRSRISAIYRVDMIVPPRTFALMTEQCADHSEVSHG